MIPDQCCQLLAKLFGQISQKIRPLAKKFGPTHNPHINTNIIVLQTIYVAEVYKKFKISADEEYVFCKYLKLFV
jgi:hypothetical protein